MCFTNVRSFVDISLSVIKLLSGHDFVMDRPMNKRKGKIYMHELCVHYTSSECALQMYEVSLNYL